MSLATIHRPRVALTDRVYRAPRHRRRPARLVRRRPSVRSRARLADLSRAPTGRLAEMFTRPDPVEGTPPDGRIRVSIQRSVPELLA
ncbi:hypothetical protein GCM10023321_79740 [Pseudonocardia eucalypti]|uniref:Uncharacterized protein n=1 Tax=Pseudonocardia eucalypti TaxID=648755 RepID=A0ABP9RCU7_9PSEU